MSRRLPPRVALVLASVLLLGLAPMALASTSSFVSPGAGGVVDLGDRVAYRLTGSSCTREEVRVVARTRASTSGRASRPVRDPLRPGSCVGIASVPTERAVRASGWDAGDRLDLLLVSRHDSVRLQYQRVELEHARAAAGSPEVVVPEVRDPDGGRRDKAVQMSTGDVVSLGHVDMTKVYAISLRLCVPLSKPHVTPVVMELRTDTPDGPPVVGPFDVANDWPLAATKASYGYPTCWQLQPWPVTGKVAGRAPELFLAVVATATPVQVSSVDLNGTGAKLVEQPPADPRGTKQILGSSLAGWDAPGCRMDADHVVRNERTASPQGYTAIPSFGFVGPSGCELTWRRPVRDVMLRFELQVQDFADNGGIFVAGHEVQLRQAGEWLTGGLLGDTVTALGDAFSPDELDDVTGDRSGGGVPASRLKLNSYPDWNQVEVVQLGKRYVVRINGRTVVDSSTTWDAPSSPYLLSLRSQPNFSYGYGVNGRFDSVLQPTVQRPSDWGNLSWRNVRLYQCRSLTDRVCAGGPGVRG